MSAPIETISSRCFSHCRQLSRVTSEAGSRVANLETGLEFCASLRLISIPSSIETIVLSSLEWAAGGSPLSLVLEPGGTLSSELVTPLRCEDGVPLH
jgi:hypothetical protein